MSTWTDAAREAVCLPGGPVPQRVTEQACARGPPASRHTPSPRLHLYERTSVPWLKSGDNAATYPALLAVASAGAADDRLLNEVAGFVWRCASQSAGHLTDGIVDLGTAALVGGSRTQTLLDVAISAGLLTRTRVDGREAFRLVEDPEFLHIREKEAVLWERQRNRDRKNPELTSAVRLRDGDSCRYCGCVVNFLDRKGGRGGTYDHYVPGEPASLDTYVVACRSHNSSMRDGDRLPLLDPPAMPYYTRNALAFLEAHGRQPRKGTYRTEPVREDDPELTEGGHRRESARPAPAEDPAAQRDQDTAAAGATLTPQRPATLDPARDTAAAGATPDPDPAKRSPGPSSWVVDEGLVPDLDGSGSDLSGGLDPPGGDRTGRDGKGRAGSGRAGPGRVGSGAAPPPGGRRRSRGRRSSRKARGGGGR